MTDIPPMSAGELDVVICIGTGITCEETSKSLHRPLETVRSIIKRVLVKTSIKRKRLLAVWAAQHMDQLKNELKKLESKTKKKKLVRC